MDEIAATKLAAFSFPKADFRPKDITLSKNFQSNIKTLTRQQNTQLQYPNKQRELRRRLCKFWGNIHGKWFENSLIQPYVTSFHFAKTQKHPKHKTANKHPSLD